MAKIGRCACGSPLPVVLAGKERRKGVPVDKDECGPTPVNLRSAPDFPGKGTPPRRSGRYGRNDKACRAMTDTRKLLGIYTADPVVRAMAGIAAVGVGLAAVQGDRSVF